MWHLPKEFDPTVTHPESWKRKNQRKNKRLRKTR